MVVAATAALLASASGPQQPAPTQKPPAVGAPATAPGPSAAPGRPSNAPPGQQPAAPTTPASPTINTVVLDPAHGGPDSGARGSGPAVESEVVLDFARAVRVSLEAQGFRVLLTREGDQDPSFDARSSLINGLRGAVFISLHVSSNGPVGTARAYSYIFPAAVPPAAEPSIAPGAPPSRPEPRPAVVASRAGLIEWDRAQFSYTAASRRLAELVQIQLAQKLRGSPETPFEVPVRQLRTVAAPAIAIEVSSVAVPDAKRLTQLNQPLADAVARAVVDFRAAVSPTSAPTGGAAPASGGPAGGGVGGAGTGGGAE